MATANAAGKTETGAATRPARRTVTGIVVSDKMNKTITVQASRKVKEPEYGKFVTRYIVYKAHDEKEQAKAGDHVELAFARRLSKTKHWRLLRIVSAARVVAVRGEEELASLPGKTAPGTVPATPPKPPKPAKAVKAAPAKSSPQSADFTEAGPGDTSPGSSGAGASGVGATGAGSSGVPS